MTVAKAESKRTTSARVIQRTINVRYEHQVHFTEDVFNPSNTLICNVLTENTKRESPKVLVVVDEALADAQPFLTTSIQRYFAIHKDKLQLVTDPLVIEGGERTKNSYFHVSEIHSQIDRFHVDRHSYVIAVGGGALLDMAGLAEATAHRGVRHVRIPTTTLSQDDSGVGVKNGINAFGKKNFIGTFAPPYAVINDFKLLETLSPRDKRAGYVEAVKVALIRDSEFFASIEEDAFRLREFDPEAMKRLIYRSAELHLHHIATSGDPFEFGSARPLDFGHWAAHKLEQISDYRIRHGEAVAIGIAVDVIYSRRMGFLDEASANRILRLLEILGFDLFANELLNVDADDDYLVMKGLEEFREHLGGELTITLLKGIGAGFEVHEVEAPIMIQSIHEAARRFGQKDLARNTASA